MPVAGLVRLRRHLFGRQAAFGTTVPATRAYPFKGVPENELNWTDPDVDTGSLDPVVAPHREAPALTASLEAPQVAYNDLPIMFSAFFGDAVSPSESGTAETWLFEPASTTLDELDLYTYEFGDDVVDDWFQLGDGILDSFDLTIPEGLGPVTGSLSWRFGSLRSTGSTDAPATAGVPQALSVDNNPALVYGKDLSIYISSDPDTLDANQILDALHTGVIRFSGDIGEKRWANGTQKFDANAYVRETRMIEVELTLAKTDDTVGSGSESDAWMSDESVNRYIKFEFISTAMADDPVPYSFSFIMPMRYYTRTEGEVGGNSVIVLTGHGFYDSAGLGSGSGAPGILSSEIVCTLTEAELGSLGS